MVIDATGADEITSVMIDNQGGDGIVFDSVAFSAEPMPQVSVAGFGPAVWGAPPATLGIQGAIIEDFEDATLVPRAAEECDCPAGHAGPTGVLPLG